MIDFNYDYKTVYRLGTCHIESKKKQQSLSLLTVRKKLIIQKKYLSLGDSLAAHLYPGINEKYKRDFNIYQRTTGACKPYIIKDKDKKTKDVCQSINSFIVDEIVSIRPAKVFISGFWKKEDLKSIQKIIDFLNDKNIDEIYLVGPSPRWHDPLPKILFKEYRLKRKLPDYLGDKNHQEFFKLDKQFEAFTIKMPLNIYHH